MTSHVEAEVQRRIEAARRREAEQKRQREELAAARTAGLARRNARRLRNQVQAPKDGFGVRVYRRHNCQAVHDTWASLAQCVWPAAEVAGDGPFAAVSCSARTVTLSGVLAVALARKRVHDRDSCGPDCTRRHQVVALDPGPEPSGAAA